MSTITWSLRKVKASELKPNAKNPKKRDDAGFERLKKSLEKFGRVFDGIANADYSVIDGHSRLELSNPDDDLLFFFPSRKLSKKEYVEMNAVFDMAKAGETDMMIIEEQFTEEFFKEWGINIQDTSTSDISIKNLNPYKKVHVMISCEANQFLKIQEMIEKIKEIGVELEISSN